MPNVIARDRIDYLRWRKRCDPLVPKVETAAAQVSLAKPYHAKAATNDGCYFRSVELTARGADGFGTYGHKIMEIQLPGWEQQTKLMWPPDRHVDYSYIVPVFEHPGADWWRVKEEEEACKRAEATRLEAEYLQQQARDRDRVARAADDRRRGIIAL